MKNIGRNSLAAGLGALLVSSALSFTAQAHEHVSAHAEARFLMDAGVTGVIVEELGDQLEDGATTATAPPSETNYQTSPLEPLEMITVPIGDAAGSGTFGVGAIGNYASADADTGAARGASGAVTSDGIVQVGGGDDVPPANATLELNSGLLGELGLTDLIADLRLEVGAISASADLDEVDGTVTRDYNIADMTLELELPVLAGVLDELETALGTALGDIDSLGTTAICEALSGAGGVIASICALAVNLITVDIDVPSVNEVLDTVTELSGEGLMVDLSTGLVTIDLNEALLAAGADINDFEGTVDGTSLLPLVLDDVLSNLDDLVVDSVAGLADTVLENTSITLSAALLGPVTLNASQLSLVLDPVLDTLGLALGEVTDPLGAALSGIAGALEDLLDIRVNTWDLYDSLEGETVGILGETPAETGVPASVTALRLVVADGLPVAGPLVDLRLANALVVPGEVITQEDEDADAVADADADEVADADADAVADADADAVADADADADTVADADADTVADADADTVADADADTVADADADTVADADADTVADADATDADAVADADADAVADADADAVADADADTVADADATDADAAADAQADAATDADAASDAQTDAAADAQTDVASDSDGTDGAADAGTVDTLPSTGAPNLLPLWILAGALILFGSAVLLNEKRRSKVATKGAPIN